MAGVEARSIDPKTNPGGSGHDWVKTQFAQEAANLAGFAEGRGVLGLLDEDGRGATVRQQEVAGRLRERGLGPISAGMAAVCSCQRAISKLGFTGSLHRGVVFLQTWTK